MSQFDKRRERFEVEGTNDIMKKAQESAKKNKELCTLRALTIREEDLKTLKNCTDLDGSGIIQHLITLVETETNK